MAERGSSARLLAPTALVVAALIFAFIVLSSGGGGPSSSTKELERTRTTKEKTRATKTTGRLPRRNYIVKPGDSLSSISQKTGLPVSKIQELNPDVDPQALISGQKIRLR